MGSITARKGADGNVSYRAAIRINKKAIQLILKAKHFIQKVAENWLKKRSRDSRKSRYFTWQRTTD